MAEGPPPECPSSLAERPVQTDRQAALRTCGGLGPEAVFGLGQRLEAFCRRRLLTCHSSQMTWALESPTRSVAPSPPWLSSGVVGG